VKVRMCSKASLTTELQLYKACCILLYVTIATATIVIAYTAISQRPVEVFYAITVEDSVYQYPYWNITLRVKQEIPVELHIAQIYYKGIKIAEGTVKFTKLGEGDQLTLINTFNTDRASGENFTLFLWFDEHKYQQFALSLPEEKPSH